MAIPGSLWIDGTTLRLINPYGSEYYYTGNITTAAPTQITLTSIAATGSLITFGFAAQASIPFSIGSTIVVSGVSPSAYNNTYVVSNCSTTSVVVQSTTNAGAMTTSGTVSYSIVPGSIWVDSLYLYYVDSSKNIRVLPASGGNLQISTYGTLGSISGTGPYTAVISNMSAVDGADVGTIIQANGMSTGTVTVTAVLSSTSIAISSTAPLTAGTIYGITAMNPIPGSIWIEGNYLTWISSSQSKVYGHSDVAHSDVAATPGSSTPAVPFSDNHQDGAWYQQATSASYIGGNIWQIYANNHHDVTNTGIYAPSESSHINQTNQGVSSSSTYSHTDTHHNTTNVTPASPFSDTPATPHYNTVHSDSPTAV